MSGGPPSDTQADKVLEASPFLPCFLSFRPLLELTVWLLKQQILHKIIESSYEFFSGNKLFTNNACWHTITPARL